MEVDDPDNSERNSGSGQESKNNARHLDSEKARGKRKLYVGSQALGYRRDHMEVDMCISYLFTVIDRTRHLHDLFMLNC